MTTTNPLRLIQFLNTDERRGVWAVVAGSVVAAIMVLKEAVFFRG
jgi:hypothetical protein